MIRLIIILFIVSYSCSPGTGITEKPAVSSIPAYSSDSLYIHLTGGFMQDSLVLEYAETRMIETEVTTGKHGFARALTIPRKGTESIEVRLIRPKKSYRTEIKNTGGKFIEVWYCKDDILKHYTRTEPFIYDK